MITSWLIQDYGDKFDENGKEQISLLQSRLHKMHAMIDGILKYSKIGRVKGEMKTVDLNRLINDVKFLLGPPEHIQIDPENILPSIQCDETSLKQVFQNLIGNSIKFMDKEQGIIKIGCAEKKEYWRFSVSDNGPGITHKEQEKVFQIFHTSTPEESTDSHGIGLSIVKKIIELNGGKTWIDPEKKNGTTFFFTYPKDN